MLGLQRRSSKVTHNALAVVTGAGSGIGAAFATELARRGGRVVCSGIDEVAAAKTAGATRRESALFRRAPPPGSRAFSFGPTPCPRLVQATDIKRFLPR